MSKLYNALFDSESEDSDDEIISKMAYPVTINNTVKWSHTQNVTPVPSQQNRSLHQTKVPSMIGRACTKLVVQCGYKIVYHLFRRGISDEEFGSNKEIFICNMQSDKTGKFYTNGKSDVPSTTFKILVWAGVVKEVKSWIGLGDKFRMYYPKSCSMHTSKLENDMKTHISNYVKHLQSDEKWVHKLTTKHADD